MSVMYGKIKKWNDFGNRVPPHLFKVAFVSSTNSRSGNKFYLSVDEINDIPSQYTEGLRFYSGSFCELFSYTRSAIRGMSYSPMVPNTDYVMFTETVVVE